MDFETVAGLGVSLAIGLFIGLERQRAIVRVEGDDVLLGGVRTFPLIAIAGSACALLSSVTSPWLVAAGLLGLVGLVAVHRVTLTPEQREGGLTTEVAALVTFLLGALACIDIDRGFNDASDRLLLVAALGVVTTLLLSIKPKLHEIVRKVSDEDVFATVQILVVAVVVLPLLPDEAFGPFDAIQPRQIGKMILLVGGVSFVGYVASRLMGAGRGLVVTGLIGGLVSSTAVTFSMSRRAKDDERVRPAAAVAVVAASSVMLVRVLVAVAVVHAPLLPRLVVPAGAMALVGGALLIPLVVQARRGEKATADVVLKNPFELKSAVVFGVLFAVVIFISKAARATLGDTALYLAALVAGTTDVDAITLSTAALASEGLALDIAATTILIACFANTIVKGGIAWTSGGRAFGLVVARVFGAMMLAGGLALAAMAFFTTSAAK